jgi:RHS repeat-associated protein
MTNDNTHSYSYDFENRLVAVDGGVTATYKYDPFGRRIEKNAAGEITRYYYSGHQIIEETNHNNTIKAVFTWGDGTDNLLAMTKNGTLYYYHHNATGSVIGLTNASGNAEERYEYDAFGRVSFFDASYNPIGSSAIGNNYLFTGRELDTETGLYYFRARHYNTLTGRFMQRDPLEYTDGINMYTYVKNNTINYIDPLGLKMKRCCVNVTYVDYDDDKQCCKSCKVTDKFKIAIRTSTIGSNFHAWIYAKKLNNGEEHTYGRWWGAYVKKFDPVTKKEIPGGTNEDGVTVDQEIEQKYVTEFERTVVVCDFIPTIDKGYRLFWNNCTHYATSEWERLTGESLGWIIYSPHLLGRLIDAANKTNPNAKADPDHPRSAHAPSPPPPPPPKPDLAGTAAVTGSSITGHR